MIIPVLMLAFGIPMQVCWGAEGTGVTAPMPVYAWWQEGDRDWVSIPSGGNEPTDEHLKSLGYVRDAAPQFYAYLIGTENMVPVYRWWQRNDKDWITIPDGSPSDAEMIIKGYEQKTFQYFAYRTPVPGTVAVYRWWHPNDKDWITLADGEISDGEMQSSGYIKFAEPLFYAPRTKPTDGGYFSLSAARTIMRQAGWETEAPHTLSVVQANRGGFRYWGYYGLQDCGGIGIARSNDLANWTRDPNPLLTGQGERWPSVLLIRGVFYMVHTVDYCGTSYIVRRTSGDGINFSAPTTLVSAELGGRNQNPSLFQDPVSSRIYFYWYRTPPGKQEWQILVKSAETVEMLSDSPSKLIAYAPITVAAPQVMYVGGTYYLSTETLEEGGWQVRILKSDIPDGRFVEIPGNPLLGEGSACFFQHNFGNKLHAYYCKFTEDAWTLDYRTADLTKPVATMK